MGKTFKDAHRKNQKSFEESKQNKRKQKHTKLEPYKRTKQW